MSIRCRLEVNCNKACKKKKSEMIDENTPLVKTKFHEKPPSHMCLGLIDFCRQQKKDQLLFVSFVIDVFIQD